MSIRIGIDGNEANVEKRVGVSIYTHQLLIHFQKRASHGMIFHVYLREPPMNHMPPASEYFIYHVVPGSFLWSQIALPWYLWTHREIDVFFSPAHYVPRWCPVPLVVTIHDLSYFYYPDEFLKKDIYKLKNWTAHAVAKARDIIAVSKKTKEDIEKWYTVRSTSLSVIYNGYGRMERVEANSHKQKGILQTYELESSKYILYVGTIQPRKNIPILLHAFSKLLIDKPNYKLVLVGRKGWLCENIIQQIQLEKIRKNVVMPGYVDDTVLDTLYRHACCFVLPSLYEGFGIPILEAMSRGTPVVASNTASLPEIGGEACLYFDPYKLDELYEHLYRLARKPSLRSELSQKGLNRSKRFSWARCAQETLNVITQTNSRA